MPSSRDRDAASGRPLTARQQLFVDEYLIDLNATQAAIRAGYSPTAAGAEGPRLLGNHRVAQAIEIAIQQRRARVRVDADDVLQRLYDVFLADPRSIVTVQRSACRFCHGQGHRYQFTEPEWAAALDLQSDQTDTISNGSFKAPDPKGGTGFTPDRLPHPDCPSCFGRGEAEVVIADLSQLDTASARLIAGMKQGPQGIEVKLHDQLTITKLLMRHLGLFKDRVEHEVTIGFEQALEAGRARTLQRIRDQRGSTG